MTPNNSKRENHIVKTEMFPTYVTYPTYSISLNDENCGNTLINDWETGFAVCLAIGGAIFPPLSSGPDLLWAVLLKEWYVRISIRVRTSESICQRRGQAKQSKHTKVKRPWLGK